MQDDLLPTSEYFKDFIEAEKMKLSLFERLSKISYKILKLKAPKTVEKKLSDPIELAGLKTTPSEVYSFTVLSLIFSLLFFIPISIINPPLTFIFLIFPPFIAYNVVSYPKFYSEVTKIRAGNETVKIILHMVTYLSLNPVYEKAIEFAAANSHGPIGNDLKKVVWDVNSRRFASIKDAISQYSKKWVLWNEEFVNSLLMLQLVETQPTIERRYEVLKTSLERIMNKTAKQMEDYALSLKMPSTILMMMGIVLPLMGLVMFPLISIFLANVIDTNYLVVGYLFLLPFFLWWFLYRMISKRPASFTTTEKIEEISPSEYISIGKFKIPIFIASFLIGLIVSLPGLIYFFNLYSYKHYLFSSFSLYEATKKWQEYSLSRYEPKIMLLDTFKAMFVFWGLGVSIIFYTYFRSKEPYLKDQKIRKMERELTPLLFELHATLRENVPVEKALYDVVQEYKKMKKGESVLSKLFENAYFILLKTATSLEDVFFGKFKLIENLPSSLIKNVMKIVVSSFRKGPVIASEIIGNVASYLKRIEEIEDLIKKSMRDIISNLRSQGEFIGPLIAGIVGSSAVIIIQLLEAIAKTIQSIEKMYSFNTHIGTSMYNTLKLIDFQKVMPPTVMQIIGGMYLIEIVIIIAYFLTGISRGFNKVYRDWLISRMMATAIVLFTLVFFIAVLMFQPIVMKIRV